MNEKTDSNARIFLKGIRKRLQGQRTRRRRTHLALPSRFLVLVASVMVLTVASYGPAAAQVLAPGPGSTGVGIGRNTGTVNNGLYNFSTDAFYIGNDIVVLDGADRNALLGFTFSQDGVGTDRSVSLTEIAFTGAQRSLVGLITVQRTSVFGATDQMQSLEDAGPLDVEVISRGRIDVTMNDGAVYAGIQTVFVRSSDGDTFLLPDDSTTAFDSWRETVYTNNSGISSFEIQSTSSADPGFNPLPGDWGDGLFFATESLTKSFSPITINAGMTSTLTFAITENADDGFNTTVSFTDTFPAGVVIADVPNVQNNCGGGTPNATAGAGVFGMADTTVLLTTTGASCTVSVDVTAATAGVYINSATNISGLEGTHVISMTGSALLVNADVDGDGIVDSLEGVGCVGAADAHAPPVVVDTNIVSATFGCIVTDTDNDDVPDTADECPTTPAGGVVDTDGCPFDTDLGLTKTASVSGLTPGGPAFDYTLTLTNSVSETHNVIVTDLVPATLTINGTPTASNTTSTGGSCAVAGQTVTCTWDIVPAGATETVTINVTP